MEKHLALTEARNQILKNDVKQGVVKKARIKTKLIKNWTFRLSKPKLGVDDKQLMLYFNKYAERAFFSLEHENEEGKTPHFQGYFILHSRKELETLKNMCHRSAHFEEMQKGEITNLMYCSKEITNKPDLKFW